MTLAAGSRLGPYEILASIGAGGMGEVYRARDPRLGREVAIKVLPADRMTDDERRRRFVREARAASALNHPNIVTIHEIGSADGMDFIVMEYVAGKTLDLLIPPRGMRLARLLDVAIPVADALARAHAAGLVHRDVKPSNVVVGDDGRIKVLDFGLAKAVAEPMAEGTETETEDQGERSLTLSRPGTVAGTLGYMSPEQATGRPVDARCDVFSFGAVLYEMATGRRAFGGDSRAEVLAALLKEEPRAASERTAALPQALDRLIVRCLRKEPDQRFQSMLDVKLELQQIRDESGAAHGTVARRRGRTLHRLAAVLLGVAAVLAIAWLGRRLREGRLDPPRLVPVTAFAGDEPAASLSPDGEQVAFVWSGEKQDNYDIYIKEVGSSDIRRLTTDPALDLMPNWSPDGRLIAFVRGERDGLRVHLISPIAGSERKLSDFGVAFGTPSWSPDGRWLAVARGRSDTGPEAAHPGPDIYLLPVDGGEPRALPIPAESGAISQAWFSPHGRHLAYLARVGFLNYVAVVELGAGYTPVGPPRRITRRPVWPDAGGSWSRDGRSFLYGEWGILRLRRAALTGDGPSEPVEIAGLGALRPSVAARRDRLVFVRDLRDKDIYRFGAGGPDQPVIASSYQDADPQFSPDGQRLAFMSQRSGESEIWVAGSDGSGAVQLTHARAVAVGSPRWSPDGRRIAFDAASEDGSWDIWTIGADGASPRQLTHGPGDENLPSWSRDGRFVYYAARSPGSVSGGFDVWKSPAEGGAGSPVTHGGGGCAHESMDGKTLYFMRDVKDEAPLLAVPLAGGPPRQIAACVSTFAVTAPGVYAIGCPEGGRARLLRWDAATGREQTLGQLEGAQNSFTVSPDGKSVLYTRLATEGSDVMMIDNFR